MRMNRRVNFEASLLLLLLVFFFFFFSCLIHFSLASTLISLNPFTAKASLIRYWNKQISNNYPISSFLLSKASPLSTIDSAFYSKLASEKNLSSHLSTFCSSASLYCFFDSKPIQNPDSTDDDSDADFALYTNKKFSNYGASRVGGVDMFKNYSDGANFATGSFTKYSRSSTGHQEDFTSYASDGNVATSTFTSYAAGSTGGAGDFKNYMARVNVPDLRFASYDSSGNHHELSFTSYVDDTNSGNQGFISYAKNGNGVPVEFTSYGTTSNVIGSSFTGYNEAGNGANDSFKGYGINANNPSNNFKNYGNGVNGGVDSFTSYRNAANAGTDTFQSYGRNSNVEKSNFINYGKTFNGGVDTFKEYGKGSSDQETNFKMYGLNNTFKDYAKKGVTFGLYTKGGSKKEENGKSKNMWVEEGKFFREHMLKEGSIMKMPDIRDRMPKRSFLPRTISSKLPFSSDELLESKRIFKGPENSTMEFVLKKTLSECERVPSKGETKQCVGSVEDLIDFAVSILGNNVVVRTTDNIEGSAKNVMIGKVKGINGGKVTQSVSCHQSLYPYLVYYCHSVPKVRVYVADILDVGKKSKINRGVAICHIDTSSWSPGHSAFVALGSSPGFIEVCHWIFENDMTWTVVD